MQSFKHNDEQRGYSKRPEYEYAMIRQCSSEAQLHPPSPENEYASINLNLFNKSLKARTSAAIDIDGVIYLADCGLRSLQWKRMDPHQPRWTKHFSNIHTLDDRMNQCQLTKLNTDFTSPSLAHGAVCRLSLASPDLQLVSRLVPYVPRGFLRRNPAG